MAGTGTWKRMWALEECEQKSQMQEGKLKENPTRKISLSMMFREKGRVVTQLQHCLRAS